VRPQRASIVPVIADADVREVALALQLIRQIGANLAPASGGDADASLTEQLHSLYAEREHLEAQLGTSDAARIVERVRSLASQLASVQASLATLSAHLGSGDLVDFVMRTESTIESLTQQLHSVYADREGDAGSAPAPTTNFEEQLRSLYADREELTSAFGSADAEEIAALVLEREAGFVEQLHAIYGEREELAREIGHAEPLSVILGDRAAIESMGAQIAVLYADRERTDARHLETTVENLVTQLESIYAEREHQAPPKRSPLDEIRSRFLGS
jgi:hypothetical protein